MKTLFKWIGTLGLAGVLSACGGGDGGTTSYGNLAEVAQKNNFTALLAAVNKAGIASTLTAPAANLTVFAPTDTAFGTLATQLGFANAGAMVTALSPSDLSKILTYHVVPGTKYAADLKAGGATQSTAYNFSGTPAKLALNTTSGVAITDAALATSKVASADVRADNGVIHVGQSAGTTGRVERGANGPSQPRGIQFADRRCGSGRFGAYPERCRPVYRICAHQHCVRRRTNRAHYAATDHGFAVPRAVWSGAFHWYSLWNGGTDTGHHEFGRGNGSRSDHHHQ